MGSAASSATITTLADNSSSPNALAVLAVAQAINKTTLKQLTLTSQREFHLSAEQLHTLFTSVAKESVDQAFAIFDSKRSGVVDSCELLATLILAAKLPRDTKQRAIFELFNISTHRIGLMVADEATLLFRTVVAGAAKLLCVLGSTSQTVVASELPPMPIFENLTKTLYGEQETITYEVFAQLCRDTAEINIFIEQWAFDSE